MWKNGLAPGCLSREPPKKRETEPGENRRGLVLLGFPAFWRRRTAVFARFAGGESRVIVDFRAVEAR
jgi:hypothetical protein